MGNLRWLPSVDFRLSLGGRLAIGAAAGLLIGTAASAQETVTYSYDALGRVVTSSHSGSVNAGLTQTYTHDAADNRTNVTVAGSAFTGRTRVIVVPLGKLTIIPLGNGQ